eukprot:gene18840-6404_t
MTFVCVLTLVYEIVVVAALVGSNAVPKGNPTLGHPCLIHAPSEPPSTGTDAATPKQKMVGGAPLPYATHSHFSAGVRWWPAVLSLAHPTALPSCSSPNRATTDSSSGAEAVEGLAGDPAATTSPGGAAPEGRTRARSGATGRVYDALQLWGSFDSAGKMARPEPHPLSHAPSPALQLEMMTGCIRLCAHELTCITVTLQLRTTHDSLNSYGNAWQCVLTLENNDKCNSHTTQPTAVSATAVATATASGLGATLHQMHAVCYPISLASTQDGAHERRRVHTYANRDQTQPQQQSQHMQGTAGQHCSNNANTSGALLTEDDASTGPILINDVDKWQCIAPQEVALNYTMVGSTLALSATATGTATATALVVDSAGRMPMLLPSAAIVARVPNGIVDGSGYGAVTTFTVASLASTPTTMPGEHEKIMLANSSTNASSSSSMHVHSSNNNAGTRYSQQLRERRYIFGKWYHSLGAVKGAFAETCADIDIDPGLSKHNLDMGKKQANRVVHISAPLLNLMAPFAEFYQHTVFDVLPRLALALPLLRADPSMQVLHSGSHKDLLTTFAGIPGLQTRMIAAQPCTTY